MDGTYPLPTELDAEEIGNLRLLDAARITRARARPEMFTMRETGHDCGTPGCVLGCVAVSGTVPGLRLVDFGGLSLPDGYGEITTDGFRCALLWATDYYALTYGEAESLFDAYGCNNAQSPAEAADFLERFVAKRRAARGM